MHRRDTDYRVVFLTSTMNRNLFGVSFFDTLNSMGWGYERILLDSESDEYGENFDCAWETIQEAAKNSQYLIFNGIVIDLFWPAYTDLANEKANENASEVEDGAEIIDCLRCLRSENIYTFVDINAVHDLAEPDEPDGKQKAERIKAIVEHRLETLTNSGANVTKYTIESVALDAPKAVVTDVVSIGSKFAAAFHKN